jgi:hypothetical protein
MSSDSFPEIKSGQAVPRYDGLVNYLNHNFSRIVCFQRCSRMLRSLQNLLEIWYICTVIRLKRLYPPTAFFLPQKKNLKIRFFNILIAVL